MAIRWEKSIYVLLSCLAFFLSSWANAADTTKIKYSAKVKLNVTASDSIKSSLSSFLSRELRALNDVELVDENPDWLLNIVAMELKNKGGYTTGIAISTNINSPFSNQMLSGWFQPKFKDVGLNITNGLYWLNDQWLNVGSSDDLQHICRDIVADFDTNRLEPSRKFFRQINSK